MSTKIFFFKIELLNENYYLVHGQKKAENNK